jgi:hypothetical protein
VEEFGECSLPQSPSRGPGCDGVHRVGTGPRDFVGTVGTVTSTKKT